jgi:hypothetical protein
MKNKTGWLRLFIVISILYFLISALYGMATISRNATEYAQALEINCLNELIDKRDLFARRDCEDSAKNQSKKDIGQQRIEMFLVMSIMPLALAWILGFITLWTFRWVMAGFE